MTPRHGVYRRSGIAGASLAERTLAEPLATQQRGEIMGKGDKQHGNREAKKPKADKKLAPATSNFLKPQADLRKPAGKPPAK